MTNPWLIQVHGEWSGLPEYDWMDIDFEAETEREARIIINNEVPEGVPYLLYDPYNRLVEEGVGTNG